MSKIEFDEIEPELSVYDDETSGLVDVVMRFSGGVIKNKKQANYFLVFIISLSLIFSLFLVYRVFSGTSEPPQDYRGEVLKTPDV